MTNQQTDKLFAELEEMGEDAVRLKLAQGIFGERKINLVKYWLEKKENETKNVKVTNHDNDAALLFDEATAWRKIQSNYGVKKILFGRKIKFVSDQYKRKIIFRDIAQAYVLANAGYSKPAVILAGSVIEELLRLYLDCKGITPSSNTFNAYIKACEDNGLLKAPIRRLTDSVRYFRNLVHLEGEVSSRETISKATALGAVTSIFTIANDF